MKPPTALEQVEGEVLTHFALPHPAEEASAPHLLRAAERQVLFARSGKRTRSQWSAHVGVQGPPLGPNPPQMSLSDSDLANLEALRAAVPAFSRLPAVAAQLEGLHTASPSALLTRLMSLAPPAPVGQRLHARPDPAPPGGAVDLRHTHPVLCPERFQGGRLGTHTSAWHTRFPVSSFRSAQLAHTMLANGWSARMKDWPRHSREHIDRPNFVPADLAPVATDTVAELLATGCIEDVTDRAHLHQEVSYILPLLMVPKKGTDKMRMCFDARELNQRIENFHFKMETADVAARLMRPGDYMFTIDLWQGYYQIPLRQDFRRFCCFRWNDRIYRWCVLPFGVSTAPRVFSKLIRVVLEGWRRDGIRCSGYIDDLIFFARTWEEALALRTRVLADLEALGFQLNAAKVHLTPTQSVEFLGYILQSTPYTVLRVPKPKVDAVQAQARLLLSHARRHNHVSARSIASLAGRILSFRLASPVARLCTRGAPVAGPLRDRLRGAGPLQAPGVGTLRLLPVGAGHRRACWRDSRPPLRTPSFVPPAHRFGDRSGSASYTHWRDWIKSRSS